MQKESCEKLRRITIVTVVVSAFIFLSIMACACAYEIAICTKLLTY